MSDHPPHLRYRAISRAKPLQTTDLPFSLSILAIWTVSSGIALPALLYSTTKVYPRNNVSSTACLLVWPDGESYVSFMDHVYQVIYLVSPGVCGRRRRRSMTGHGSVQL